MPNSQPQPVVHIQEGICSCLDDSRWVLPPFLMDFGHRFSAGGAGTGFFTAASWSRRACLLVMPPRFFLASFNFFSVAAIRVPKGSKGLLPLVRLGPLFLRAPAA